MRTSHGVTTINGVRWLVQNQSLTNAIGLPGLPDFQRSQYKYDAPHNLDLNVKSTPQLERDLDVIMSDPVARFFLPSIIDPLSDEILVKYSPEPDIRVIERLTYLWGNGTWSRTQSFRQYHRLKFNRQIGDTNILPLIYYGATVQDQRAIDTIVAAPLQNRLLIFGDNTPVLPVWSVMKIGRLALRLADIINMDLPSIGALYLRNCMRA